VYPDASAAVSAAVMTNARHRQRAMHHDTPGFANACFQGDR
jgi:hypothetical protein